MDEKQLARLKEITEHVKVNAEFYNTILSIGMFTLPMLPTVKAELEAKAKAERERVNRDIAKAQGMDIYQDESQKYTSEMYDRLNFSVQDIQNRIKALTDGTE